MLVIVGYAVLSAYFSYHITSCFLEERAHEQETIRRRSINEYYYSKRKYISKINNYTLSKQRKRRRNKTISLPIQDDIYHLRKKVSFSYIRDMEYIPNKDNLQDKDKLWYSTEELLHFKYTQSPERLNNYYTIDS